MNTPQSSTRIMIVEEINKHDMVGCGINRVRRKRIMRMMTSNKVHNRDAI